MANNGPRRSRTFLARPFWRDYVLAYLLIGVGFMITSPAFPRASRVVGAVLLAIGAAIFACAMGWSFWSTLRGRLDAPAE
jgi:hypothetical protein